jgi:GntR family transcriptional regulator
MTLAEGLLTPIRNRSDVPVAIQVSNHLRGWLRREYANGGQLPSELVIAAQLRVSRGTVRQALAILQHEGLVARRQGLGTFATPNVDGIPARIDFAYEFTELIQAAGYEAELRTLDISTTCAGPDEVRRLGVRPSELMLRVRKLFLASGTPAIFVDEVLPTRLIVEDYDPEELKRPIWRFIDCRCHHRIKYVLSELMAAEADDDVAALLRISPRGPVLKFVESFHDTTNAPLVLAHLYFRDQLIRFHALRKVAPVV